MFIVYGSLGTGASISALLLSGLMAEILLLLFQAATVYVVVRRMDFLVKRPFAGMATVGQHGPGRPAGPGDPVHHPRRDLQRRLHPDRVRR